MIDAETSPEATLAQRVERSELRREALEVLSLLGDARARRALGLLPLVLTVTPAEVRAIDDDRSLPAEAWLGLAGWLTPFGRRPCVAGAVALVELLREGFPPEEPPPSAHLGLHTGPFGFVHLTDALAREVFPLGRTVDRVMRASRAFLETPDPALAQAVEAAWPSLLMVRARAELAAELAGVDPRAVWACRFLVASVAGPLEEAPAALAAVASHAEACSGDRDRVRAVLREVLSRALLTPA